MSFAAAEAVARALLYEGYLLYPYRQSGLKNQKRWAFGTLLPPGFAKAENDRSTLSLEVLLQATSPAVRVGLAFLQWVERIDPGRDAWLEAKQRLIDLPALPLVSIDAEPKETRFAFPAESWTLASSRYASEAVAGIIALCARRLGGEIWKLTLTASNTLALDGAADSRTVELGSLVSAHVLLEASGGTFVSLLDPPLDLAHHARECKNQGVWPVLVGEAGRASTMLASPICVYDYPAIAPESPGDFYDVTEIDEMLVLRVQTLTDGEKQEARETDPRAAALIDRSEAMSESTRLLLHGASRKHPGVVLCPGDRVRLHPHTGRDIFDIALAGEVATVVSTEQDFEGRQYCTVTVDADPGRDLGATGQIGHRFFFDLDELERLP